MTHKNVPEIVSEHFTLKNTQFDIADDTITTEVHVDDIHAMNVSFHFNEFVPSITVVNADAINSVMMSANYVNFLGFFAQIVAALESISLTAYDAAENDFAEALAE